MTSPAGAASQDAYAARLDHDNFPFTLAVGAAFVRGMREVGYRNTATALSELVDNSAEADASQVHVIFGYDQGSKKPSRMAVIDDGHGMSPSMLRAAVLWGGTHREDGREGLGRFGYGLPSSCVSQGRSFDVFSKRKNQAWHKVGIDLDAIADGLFTTESGHIVVPPAQRSELPEFVRDYIDAHASLGKLSTGTVIVIDKLDRIDRKTTSSLIELLKTHFAVTYHRLIGEFSIYVDDDRVEAIDPLFLTRGHKWFDTDADRAKALPPIAIKVKATDTRPGGQINIRMSYLPYSFHLVDKSRAGRSGSNFNGRFYIMRDYNGIIVSRNARVIETKLSTPWTRFQNNDRHVRIELDFSASLDDEFRINTSKQRVEISDRIWQLLRENGLEEAIRQARRMYTEDKVESEVANVRDETGLSAAEKILQRLKQKEARKDNANTNQPVFEAIPEPDFDGVQPRLDLGDQLYKIGQRPEPGGRFFDVETVGPQRILWINTEHEFYDQVYAHADMTPFIRQCLELTLFLAGERALGARGEAAQNLTWMLGKWSDDLAESLKTFADEHKADV